MPRQFARAEPGEEIPISITQYCLKGTTRRGRFVRPGIVAADPRIFPLARYVEVFMGKEVPRPLPGRRHRRERDRSDTRHLDAIVQAGDAISVDTRGKAVLVAKEEEHILPQTLVELNAFSNLSAIGEMFEGLAKRYEPERLGTRYE